MATSTVGVVYPKVRLLVILTEVMGNGDEEKVGERDQEYEVDGSRGLSSEAKKVQHIENPSYKEAHRRRLHVNEHA